MHKEMRFELNIDIQTELTPEQVARMIKVILEDEMAQGFNAEGKHLVRIQSVIPR